MSMDRDKKQPNAQAQHLDGRVVLDYLDGGLAAPARKSVETHLAGACADCRELLRATAALRATMRSDRRPPVPAFLRDLAVGVFGPAIEVGLRPSLGRRLARMVFDSLAAPAPAAARRSAGETRRLRFSFGDDSLDVELEPLAAGVMAARGRLHASDPALYRISFTAHDEVSETWPDSRGSFAVAQLPSDTVVIRIDGPAGEFELPPIEP